MEFPGAAAGALAPWVTGNRGGVTCGLVALQNTVIAGTKSPCGRGGGPRNFPVLLLLCAASLVAMPCPCVSFPAPACASRSRRPRYLKGRNTPSFPGGHGMDPTCLQATLPLCIPFRRRAGVWTPEPCEARRAGRRGALPRIFCRRVCFFVLRMLYPSPPPRSAALCRPRKNQRPAAPRTACVHIGR